MDRGFEATGLSEVAPRFVGMAPDLLTPLTASVSALARVRVEELAMTELQELGAGVVAARDRLDGIWSRVLGELQVRGQGLVPDGTGSSPTPAWVRQTAHVSGSTAGRAVRTSVALRELPEVSAAVLDGVLTLEHARVLTRLVGRIEPSALLGSQPQLIDVARRTDPEQLATYVRHLIATWCPPELEKQEADAINGRFLQLTRKHNGRTRGVFELPDADAEILLTVLEPLARRDGNDDQRPAGMRRADALTDVFTLALRYGDLPDAGGCRPVLTYVIGTDPRPERFAIDPDHAAAQHCPSAPWTGPATQATIDQLLCDSRRLTLTTGPDGRIISLLSHTDEITTAQRRAVAARDRCCTAKGCTRPPAFCDVHHVIARADGGPTETANLVLLCRRHHTAWHRGRLGHNDLRIPWLRAIGATSGQPPPARE